MVNQYLLSEVRIHLAYGEFSAIKPYTTRRTYILAPADWNILEDITCENKFQKGIWFGEGPSGL